ncbi:thermospermine synthase ACAULIS5-like [Cajanus cajan]|uniref:thermospermine synthase ACAULIS5-like n=1 Tax=Cajanus cajan TaxID=3821 RepID=UPI00098DA380|nr:thermospermine synthase ACAULIS5-like [Cajanus cajan]
MGNGSIIWMIFRALVTLFIPSYLNLNEEYFELNLQEDHHMNLGVQEDEDERGGGENVQEDVINGREWFEQEIDSDVKWSLALDSVVFEAASEFQSLSVLSTKRFGKALVIDGHLQNTELDEYIYNENLVHPSLLIHNEIPKTVFIMGGGGGSAAREVLKHKDIEKVIICDIDRSTADLIREHMTANHETFNDERLQLVQNDAKYELEKSEEKFDVIIGDLSDPDQSGPVHIYTKSFYQNVAKPKLKENGIFVTQAGPAGIFTHKAVFSTIYNTLKQAFPYVVAYTALVPSYGDSYGWILASSEQFNLDAEEIDTKIGERLREGLRYLDGAVIIASMVLNKALRKSLIEETRILTDEKVVVGFVRKPGIHRYA